MTDNIRLYSPQDIPFGRLSNNSYHPIIIDGKKYSTVTNYIFSCMVLNSSNKKLLQQAEITGGKGANKELLDAIDFLIGESKPESKKVATREEKIMAFVKEYGNEKELYESLPDEEINREYENIKRKKTKRRTVITREQKISALVNESRKDKREYEMMSDKEVDREYRKVKAKTDEMAVEEAFLEMATANTEERNAFEKREAYKHYISRQVRKPFDSIDLKELKANMLQESRLNTSGIYKLLDSLIENELYEVLYRAVDDGFRELILGTTKSNELKIPELSVFLVATENRPIIFEDGDRFLGVGKNKKGFNIVGKVLEQIRHNIKMRNVIEQRNRKRESKKKNVMSIYTAYMILNEEIVTNKNRLDEYIGLTTEQIIEKYGLSNIASKLPSESAVMKLYSECNLNEIVMNEINTPNTLVNNVRKFNFRNLQSSLKEYKRELIFNSYLEDIITKKFKDAIDKEVEVRYRIEKLYNKDIAEEYKEESKEKIRDEIIQDIMINEKFKLPPSQLSAYKQRVIDLFNLKMFSSKITDSINENIKLLNIPTDAEVYEIENQEIKVGEQECELEEKFEESSEKSVSEEENQIEKYLKQTLGHEKQPKSELIRMLIDMRGGKKSDYEDMSAKELRALINSEKSKEIQEEKEIPREPKFQSGFVPPFGEPVIIYRDDRRNRHEYKAFSPECYTGMIKIKNKYYPTIQHYILTSLIASAGLQRSEKGYEKYHSKGIGIDEAREYIVLGNDLPDTDYRHYKNLQDISRAYENLDELTNHYISDLATVTALTKKFQDPELQNLLVATGKRIIEWDSPYKRYMNLTIGTDENRGGNYVGFAMMDIREKIKENFKTETRYTKIKDITRIAENDSIVKEWVIMRIKDMCGTVNKFQKYLKFVDDFDFDLEHDIELKKLVNLILDTVYKPCRLTLSESENVEMPAFVFDTIRNCKGMSSKNFDVKVVNSRGNLVWKKEILDRISETAQKIKKLGDKFYGLATTEHSKSESLEFEAKQRKDYDKFIDELMGYNITKEEKDKLLELAKKGKQRKEYKEFKAELVERGISREEKDKQIKLFKKSQIDDYNEFWGITPIERTEKEFDIAEQKYKNEVKELELELDAFLRNAETKQNHYLSISREIAELYWKRIAGILAFVVNDIAKNPIAYNIRDVLIRAETFISRPVKCVKIVSDKENNCIISALLNLLKSISRFKQEFSDNQALNTDDVILAGSIILNSAYKPLLAPAEAEEKEEREEEPEEKGFLQFEEGELVQEEEPKDEFEKLLEEMENDEKPEFAFHKKQRKSSHHKHKFAFDDTDGKNSEAIRNHLLRISDKDENYDAIVAEMIKMTKTIKNADIPEKIKTARINFFANIKRL